MRQPGSELGPLRKCSVAADVPSPIPGCAVFVEAYWHVIFGECEEYALPYADYRDVPVDKTCVRALPPQRGCTNLSAG